MAKFKSTKLAAGSYIYRGYLMETDYNKKWFIVPSYNSTSRNIVADTKAELMKKIDRIKNM